MGSQKTPYDHWLQIAGNVDGVRSQNEKTAADKCQSRQDATGGNEQRRGGNHDGAKAFCLQNYPDRAQGGDDDSGGGADNFQAVIKLRQSQSGKGWSDFYMLTETVPKQRMPELHQGDKAQQRNDKSQQCGPGKFSLAQPCCAANQAAHPQ